MLKLRQVALIATALEPVVADLRAVFGLRVAFEDPDVLAFGLSNVVLPLDEQFIEVVAPGACKHGGRALSRTARW